MQIDRRHRRKVRGHPPHEQRLQNCVDQQQVQLPLSVLLHSVHLGLYPQLERADEEHGQGEGDVDQGRVEHRRRPREQAQQQRDRHAHVLVTAEAQNVPFAQVGHDAHDCEGQVDDGQLEHQPHQGAGRGGRQLIRTEGLPQAHDVADDQDVGDVGHGRDVQVRGVDVELGLDGLLLGVLDGPVRMGEREEQQPQLLAHVGVVHGEVVLQLPDRHVLLHVLLQLFAGFAHQVLAVLHRHVRHHRVHQVGLLLLMLLLLLLAVIIGIVKRLVLLLLLWRLRLVAVIELLLLLRLKRRWLLGLLLMLLLRLLLLLTGELTVLLVIIIAVGSVLVTGIGRVRVPRHP